MGKSKVRMRDISESAGVAISTVSHVLNGTAPISEEVRTRVMAAARELGYLAKRREKAAITSIGRVLMVVPEEALPESDVNLVSWTILSALTKDCETRGIAVTPMALTDRQPVDAVMRAAEEAKADGIILINDDRSHLLKAISASNIPAVLINGEDPEMHMDSVTPGNRFAAMKATNMLIKMGHKKIAHLTWSGRKTVSRRQDGFLDAFTEQHLEHDNAIILKARGFEPKHGEQAISEWQAEHPDLQGVTAIFCAADNLAFGAIKALKQAGLQVPDDVSVMGFDGVALGALHSPALTTVNVPLEQFGSAALDLLEQRARKTESSRAAHRLELGCDVIVRASIKSVSI